MPQSDAWQPWRALTLAWGLLLLASCLFMLSAFSPHTLVRYLAATPLFVIPLAAMAHSAQVWDELARREAARQEALRIAATARTAPHTDPAPPRHRSVSSPPRRSL